ncbi:MAG: dihydroorotate dehydrogenase [Candidatus Sumerlaeia bacterium]|nr:dihydroorotate dehydrogenase [Candidatus Sumerlaeia bacterium]
MESKPTSIVSLEVAIGGVRLKNPVTVASGTFGYGREFEEFFDLSRLGAIAVKGLTLQPRAGNKPPRVVETPAGMLNAIGLENVGIERYLAEKLPYLRRLDTVIIANISGFSVDEYRALTERLCEARGADLIEVNVSCPNVQHGGMAFGSDPAMLEQITRAVVDRATVPVIVKLSPNVTDIAAMARVVEQSGGAAVSLVNTFLAMVIDVERRRPVLGNRTGGLSGPAIRPIAVRMVREVFGAVKIPIIGIGGIMTARDALEFILAGATAVAVGTANFVNPTAAVEVLDGIERYCLRHGIGDIRELVGALQST